MPYGIDYKRIRDIEHLFVVKPVRAVLLFYAFIWISIIRVAAFGLLLFFPDRI